MRFISQARTRRGVPCGVGQGLPGRKAGRIGQRPRAKFFAQLRELVLGAEQETDACAGQPEELAQRAQDEQVGRRVAASQRSQAVLRIGVAKRLVDNQPAATSLQLFGGLDQYVARQRQRRGIVRIAEQHHRRHRSEQAR